MSRVSRKPTDEEIDAWADEPVEPKTKRAPPSKSFLEKRYGLELMAKGYRRIPIALFDDLHLLGLDTVDRMIVLTLLRYWGNHEWPYPRRKLIARAVGLSVNRIRDRIEKMEQRGLIKRIERKAGPKRNSSNRYDLSGLIKKLNKAIREREARRAVNVTGIRLDRSLQRPLQRAGEEYIRKN